MLDYRAEQKRVASIEIGHSGWRTIIDAAGGTMPSPAGFR